MQINLELTQGQKRLGLQRVFMKPSGTYQIRLTTSGGSVSGQAATFGNYGIEGVQLTAPVYFAIPAGVTVLGVRIYAYTDELDNDVWDGNLDTPKVYTSNGTLTIAGWNIVT